MQPSASYTQLPSSVLAEVTYCDDALSVQPRATATQPASTVAVESKLSAVASVHPYTCTLQLPSSTVLIAR